MVFLLHSIKKVHHYIMNDKILLDSKNIFSIIAHKYLIFVSYLTQRIWLKPNTFWFVNDCSFVRMMTIELHGRFIYKKGDTKHPN